MRIQPDDPAAPEVAALLREHLENMRAATPPESVHALDIEALRRPGIAFWSVWEAGTLAGCGALKELDARHAEIKSMCTAQSHRGKGVARRLLEHMLAEGRRRGYRRISLETGAQAAFEPARKLYAGFGFNCCAPFADYVEDPNSVFMTKAL